jgi:hypothetical protein
MINPSKVHEARRHKREKAVIDHLTSGPPKPDMAPRGKKDPHQFTEDDGRKLDKALHKEWTPDKGGLPNF